MLFEELPKEEKRKRIEEGLTSLINIAKEHGFVITVDTVPNKPLAMGNYEMVASVRDAR
jgi:hypothetical protein